MIQFASGLDYDEVDDKFVVSYGINDCEGAIMFLEGKSVDGLLGDFIDDVDDEELLLRLFN